MTAFHKVQQSRRYRRCDGNGYPNGCAAIRPGSIYVRATATPDHDGLGNEGWWTLNFCTTCAAEYDEPKAALDAYRHLIEGETP